MNPVQLPASRQCTSSVVALARRGNLGVSASPEGFGPAISIAPRATPRSSLGLERFSHCSAQVGPACFGRGHLEDHNALPSLREWIAMGLSDDMAYPEADSRPQDVDWEYPPRALAEMRSVFAVGHTTTSSSGTHTADLSSRKQGVCFRVLKSVVIVKRYRCCLNRFQETPWGFKFKGLQPVARRRPPGVHVRQQ